jgi:hypothetical protein
MKGLTFYLLLRKQVILNNFLLVSRGNAILRRLLMEPGYCHVSMEDKGGFHED